MSVQVPQVTLNNGVGMPILGFGVSQIPDEATERAVLDALAAGYPHLDTAAPYGNEEAVGRAIKASGVPRAELFVTTKLWIVDGGEAGARQALETSLAGLGLDYLDLYLIHQPFGDYYSSWRAMEKASHEGLARAIGVSNFHPDRLIDLIDHNEITPAVNQVETHPFYQRAADQAFMAEHGVQIESEPGRLRRRTHRRRDAAHLSPGRRREPVLRPPRPGHGPPARDAPARLSGCRPRGVRWSVSGSSRTGPRSRGRLRGRAPGTSAGRRGSWRTP
jgi:aryl-alcohol dehydrogenase-like predicted oxidoreductase